MVLFTYLWILEGVCWQKIIPCRVAGDIMDLSYSLIQAKPKPYRE
jgi:hypothetical protein